MNLEGNASRADRQDRERGYAMAALLVMMSVMAILMSVAMPTWKQMAQREKEEELIWRGTQYARAIGAYQRKFANASPATLDVLIDQHLLRKKYKDPMAVTEDGAFALLYVANQSGLSPGIGQGTGQGTGRSGAGGQGTGAGGQGTQGGGASAGLASTTPSGNIIGVASKNTGASLRTYNEHTHYNEWQFMALQQTTRAGGAGQGGAQGAGGQGGTGGRGGSGFVPGPGGPGGGGRGRGGQDGRGGADGRGGPGGQGNPGGRGGQVNPQGGGGGGRGGR